MNGEGHYLILHRKGHELSHRLLSAGGMLEASRLDLLIPVSISE